MRLWDYRLIKFLPKSQLIAQWRELNSIYKKQDNHILINYIYDYPKSYLFNYSQIVLNEMYKREYKIVKWDNYYDYFRELFIIIRNYNYLDSNYMETLTFKEHDNNYLKICVYNLYEKYLRGQKDFSDEQWNKIKDKFKEMI